MSSGRWLGDTFGGDELFSLQWRVFACLQLSSSFVCLSTCRSGVLLKQLCKYLGAQAHIIGSLHTVASRKVRPCWQLQRVRMAWRNTRLMRG